MNKGRNLFLNHEIGSIPPELLKDIGCLENSTVISSTSTDIIKPYVIVSKFISDSNNVKHLSSVFFASNIQLLFENLEENGQIHLLFTEEILKKLLQTVNPETLEKGASLDNLKLGIVDENTKISLTLGDNFIAMGLFSVHGEYDLNTFLISQSKEAIIWGEQLFNHHLQFANEFKL
jgi:predicted transcriptional regulator